MVDYQERSRRLATGAKVHSAHKKRKSRLGRNPIETKVGDERKKIVRTRGGNIKIKAYNLETINVTDKKNNVTKNVPIKGVSKNTASIDYQRRSILTKGAIVQTELGTVKVTSRPGQCGLLNGILIDKQ